MGCAYHEVNRRRTIWKQRVKSSQAVTPSLCRRHHDKQIDIAVSSRTPPRIGAEQNDFLNPGKVLENARDGPAKK